MQFFYVYVGKRDNDWYIGYTADLRRRVEEHKQKYPFDLLYYEAYTDESKARDRERKLKYYGSGWRALRDRIA